MFKQNEMSLNDGILYTTVGSAACSEQRSVAERDKGSSDGLTGLAGVNLDAVSGAVVSARLSTAEALP